MQSKSGWNSPANAANQNSPSARLRASRPMPAWMQVTRSGPAPPPPPPRDEPPVDPDYEVIDFGNNGQIYSNAPLPIGNNKSGKRCDLCGSSAPAVRCVQCTQNFCLSCDHMYHRHPKRQAHTRKELQENKVRPPLPPKGEAVPAPVPPPRRNKTSGRPPPARPAVPPLQRGQEVKSQTLHNSLQRPLPSRPLANPPFPPMQNGMAPSPLHQEMPSPLDMHNHHGNMGASEWDVHRRSRTGSFSNLAAPGFSPLLQAQSMAQLNSPCPSCHFHGPTPPMSPWANNDPWGTWGAMPPWQSQNFLNHPSSRRGSRRGSMRHRREASSGTDEEDERMSRRGGTRRGNVSPTPSRRSRAPPSDYESEEDEGDDFGWEPRRAGTNLSRRASLVDVNRSARRRDDDTMSLTGRRFSHATMSRAQKERRYEEEQRTRDRRNTIDKIPFNTDDQLIGNHGAQRTSDADDSPREVTGSLRRKSSRRSEGRSDKYSGRKKSSPARSYYNEDPSDSPYDEDLKQNKPPPIAMASTSDAQNGQEPEDEPESEWDPIPDFDWECTHCTFVNSPGIRVCVVCCKTNTKPKRHVEVPVTKVTEKFKSATLERSGSKRGQERNQLRQQQSYDERTQERARQERQQSLDERAQERPFQKQEPHQRQQDGFNNRQAKEPESYQDRNQRQQVGLSNKQTRDQESYQELNQRQQDGFIARQTRDQDSYQERNLRQQDDFNNRQTRDQESYQERNQRQQDDFHSRQTRDQDHKPEWNQRQQTGFNGRPTRDEERLQGQVRAPEKSARGTSPMVTKRVQESSRGMDARSPDVRTPDTKTSDSSSYSSRNVTSKGTSPPPQSISTQTYEVPATKLKRATSLADYSEWRAPQRTFSRQSLLSDTQSLPVTPPKGRSPERFPDVPVPDLRREPDQLQTRRRAGSQPPDYISTLVQKQVKQGLEMVKLLREAEEQKFSADDLAVALLHCEDGDPVAWLQQNWKNMIDTVVTLATNYGHERKENTVGTISASEAREALRMHDGNVWAAVTECVEQRQKKYAELLSRGNFSREDIVTVLTANHGNLEAAYTELSKSQLKPFLMKIWGPPQGVDNESGNFTKLAHDETKGAGRGGVEQEEVSFNDFNRERVQTWIDNAIPKSKLSQSMMHLNLIGSNKTLERLEALSNMSKTEKRDLRARRTSDVHRYLTQFYNMNDNSLKISKTFTSMQDVNKPQKENTNPLWKFLEKNLNLNSFASSGNLLTTVSTTSSNVNAKSINDFDSDSLNEGGSGVDAPSDKSDIGGKEEGDETIQEEVGEKQGAVLNEILEQNPYIQEEAGNSPIAEETDGPVGMQQDYVEDEIDQKSLDGATSPVRHIFVKSITVSSEGSREVSPIRSPSIMRKQKSPDNEEASDDNSSSFESVDEDEDDDSKGDVDVNLDQNTESKEVTVLGKLILEEENIGSGSQTLQVVQAKNDRPTFTKDGAVGDVDGDEEEIMQMVENLIQKTEFMQEEPASSRNSISVMYTNKEVALPEQSPEKPPNSNNNTSLLQREEPQVGTETISDDEKEKEEFEEFVEPMTGDDGLIPEQLNQSSEPGMDRGLNEDLVSLRNAEAEPPKVAVGDPEFSGNIAQAQEGSGGKNLQAFDSEDIAVGNAKIVIPIEVSALKETDVLENDEEVDDIGDNDVFEEPPEMLMDDVVEVVEAVETVEVATKAVVASSLDASNTKYESVSQGNEVKSVVPQLGTQESSSATPQTALNMLEVENKSLLTNSKQISEGNSEKDISPIPTDSEKDGGGKKAQAGQQKLSRTKSSYELSIGDGLYEEQGNKLTRAASSHELVTLLRESLAKDDVVERIVSTLFQTVLRANEFNMPGHSREPSLHRMKTFHMSLSRDMFRGSSPSELDDSESYYEAAETKEVVPERRSRRSFRRRGRNARRRGTPRRNDDSSIMSTSTDNYSNRDEHSSSASPADVLEDLNETERETRRLLAEGIVSTYDQAELVVQLKALNFSEEDCLSAARECSSMEAAVAFLQQECDLCAGKYCMKEMVSMLECEHACCKECAQNYFTLQITERSVNDCVCPFCKEPDVARLEEDTISDYFAHLDIFLKSLVSENTHELFQRKLRDRTLMSDPNFKWCIKCSSGFIANPKQRKLICPDCRTITCAHCRRPWEKEHEKMTCEEFAAFKNEPEQDNEVEKHLAEGGVTCPKCHQRYLLAKGGCMHLVCPHCKHEFCSGCAKPFLMGAKCKISANCERLGLHSHHPRNCLFYLRDKDPPQLEQLLQEHGIEIAKNDEASSSKCKTQLLKETTDGLIEANCGHPVEGAGLCRTHYIEHLVDLVTTNKIDPVGVMDATDAVQELRRHGKELPTRADYGSDKEYLSTCMKIIREEIPLE